MLNVIAVLLYTIATLNQVTSTLKNARKSILFLQNARFFALILHGYLLYQWIDVGVGQNLTLFNLLSLATWVTAIATLGLKLIKHEVSYLNVYTYPIACISIILASQFSAPHIIQTGSHPKQLSHILLSVATFSTLFLAGLQAVALSLQEAFLKQKQFEISRLLPPIETMEKRLFEIIAAGAILLTALILTSIYSFRAILLPLFIQKMTLAVIAWVVFVTLLIGRYFFGWRGKKAIYCTLGGVIILTLTYFSRMIILELIP